MADLSNMSIQQKVNTLENLIVRARNDINYKTSCALGDGSDEELTRMEMVIENAKLMFFTGRVDQLDYDQRNIAFSNYNRELDADLSKFPEYSQGSTEITGRTK